jgi:hypothetical protein
LAALNPKIELLERCRWKNRDTFATLIEASITKLRKRRELEISDDQIPEFIDKVADHLADVMEPGAEFLLDAYQPPRKPKEHRRPRPRELGKLRGRAKLWKELVAREEQARIEVCVYLKGKPPGILFYEPINAEYEFQNEILKDLGFH